MTDRLTDRRTDSKQTKSPPGKPVGDYKNFIICDTGVRNATHQCTEQKKESIHSIHIPIIYVQLNEN